MEIFNRRSVRLMNSTREVALKMESMNKKIIYDGSIIYLTTTSEIAEAADGLIQWVERQRGDDLVPLSFDMEWPFSFKTGPGKASVVQVCVELSCCYVFQLSNLRKLPAALVALLKHPRIRLFGVNIKNDLQKLARDFPEIKLDNLKDRCVDLGVWCNEINETGGRWSLSRLCSYLISLVIYQELENRARTKKQKENEFIQNNGCAAFKAVKALGEKFLKE
uniref:3'-5' exonuclease n=1 Tax=Glossina brevipalpis TaxID=37001 RepID=A0A1A9W3J3_9MUSC